MSRFEYGTKHRTRNRIYRMPTLHDAIQAWKEQDHPNEWLVVERAVTDWQETE